MKPFETVPLILARSLALVSVVSTPALPACMPSLRDRARKIRFRGGEKERKIVSETVKVSGASLSPAFPSQGFPGCESVNAVISRDLGESSGFPPVTRSFAACSEL